MTQHLNDDDQYTVEGTVEVVAKTGGIKLKEHPDVWYNPTTDQAKQHAKPELRGKYVSLILLTGTTKVVGIGFPTYEENGRARGAPLPADQNAVQQSLEMSAQAAKAEGSPTAKTLGNAAALAARAAEVKATAQAQRQAQATPLTTDEEGLGIVLARKLKLTVNLQGREYITHPGLLVIAHKQGIKSTNADIIEMNFTTHSAIVKATVVMRDQSGKESTFTGIGDSTPENTNKMVQPSFLRMAETRAINRALRAATGVGLTSVEELETGTLPPAIPAAPQPAPQERKDNPTK